MGESAQGRLSQPPSLEDELVGATLETVSLIDGLVQDATRALFGTYGVKVDLDGSPVTRTLQSVALVSMIGFSSTVISGSLLLAMPDSVVARTLPTPEASLADWAGELSNQLLGRLKNHLLEYQVAINMSLPVVVSGGSLALPARQRPLTRNFSFVSDWGRMFVRMEIEVCATLELVREPGERNKRGMDEGEILLF